MNGLFENRVDAGRQLAARLAGMALERPMVMAVPRGGVPVAIEVARALHAPLDLLLVRKIGTPLHPEVAVAALADGHEPALEIDEETLAASGLGKDYVMVRVPLEFQEIERRRGLYMQDCVPEDLKGRDAVLVDDGVATGTSLRAVLRSLHLRHPRRVVLAVPVAPATELPWLRATVDELVCLRAPTDFVAVSRHYADFSPVSDEDVVAQLKDFRAARSGNSG